MSDCLLIYDVEELNISHVNNKNCDGYSTIISIKKHDGSTTQVTVFSKKPIVHTEGIECNDLFKIQRS